MFDSSQRRIPNVFQRRTNLCPDCYVYYYYCRTGLRVGTRLCPSCYNVHVHFTRKLQYLLQHSYRITFLFLIMRSSLLLTTLVHIERDQYVHRPYSYVAGWVVITFRNSFTSLLRTRTTLKCIYSLLTLVRDFYA